MSNPMDTPDPMYDPFGLDKAAVVVARPKCRARNRQGKQCGNYPIPGGMVCRKHGGAAPQVRDKARMRLVAMIEPALAVLGDVMKDEKADWSDKIRAANSVLDRAGYGRVQTLDVEAARDVLTQRILTIMENPETMP